VPAEELLVDKAQLLTLDCSGNDRVDWWHACIRMPTMINSARGVLTKTRGNLTNDFFVNLLDMNVTWSATNDDKVFFEGKDSKNGFKVVFSDARSISSSDQTQNLRATCRSLCEQ
jgi:catalase-peroxidase